MNFLVIETSSEKSFTLLSIGDTFSTVPLESKKQRDSLLPAIDNLLQKADLKLKDLDFIGVGNGPGSFTGTRIGVLTAKTLSFASQIPLISFCSLMVYTPETTKPFLLLIQAKSQGLYAYNGSKIKLLNSIPEGNLSSPHPERILEKIPQAKQNLPFLLTHLKESFLNKDFTPHSILTVSYFHTP